MTKQNTIVGIYLFSRVRLFSTLGTAAHQCPLSMGFPLQAYQNVLPFLSPGYLSNSGFKPTSPALQVNSLLLSHLGSPNNSGLNIISWHAYSHFTPVKPTTDITNEHGSSLLAPNMSYSAQPSRDTIKQYVSRLYSSWPNSCSISFISGLL